MASAEEIEAAESAVTSANIRVREAMYWRTHEGALRKSAPSTRGGGRDPYDRALDELEHGVPVPSVHGSPRSHDDYEMEHADAVYELERARYERSEARKYLKRLRNGG